MGLVMQEPALFDCSISENIKYGKVLSSNQEIMNSAEHSNAIKFIKEYSDPRYLNMRERALE
jgi:ABC-type multidrug transport system fused ATPase/permease subunit